MTDNEIIKALECCSKAETCDDCEKMKCPLFLDPSVGCKYVDKDNQLYSDALNLINRQQAETIRLQGMNQAKLDTIHDLQTEISELKEKYVKNFEKWELLDKRTKQFYAELYEDAKDAVKAESIKEFAERLKNEIISDTAYGCDTSQHTGYYDYQIKIGDIPEYIDNLVKERVSEDNA